MVEELSLQKWDWDGNLKRMTLQTKKLAYEEGDGNVNSSAGGIRVRSKRFQRYRPLHVI